MTTGLVLIKGGVVVLAVLLLGLWSGSALCDGIDELARRMGATAIEAKGWSELGAVIMPIEFIGASLLIGWIDAEGGVLALVGRASGWMHERTCRDRVCFLCSEWDIPVFDAGEAIPQQ